MPSDPLSPPASAVASPTSPTSLGRIALGAVVLLLVAGAARFTQLGRLDLWEDEVWTTVVSSDLASKLLRWETKGDPASSPLPWLEMKVARWLLGDTPWGLRVPAAVYGSAAVLGLYLALGPFMGWGAAFFAGLLLAVHPFALEWTRSARMYGHWLFYAVALMAMAMVCVRRTREGRIAFHDWRWWTLGMLLMLAHASATHAVMSVLAIALWLGVMGIVTLVGNWRAGVGILLGSALAGGVYLSSWALAGIGKMMFLLETRKPGGSHFGPADTVEHLRQSLVYLAGYPPILLALPLWLLALAGLVLQVRRRVPPAPLPGTSVALLVLLTGLTPCISYATIASRHFFSPRYFLPAVLLLCVGLGAAMAWAWNEAPASWRRGLRIGVIVLLAGLAAAWAPAWREVYFVHKVQVHAALAPILQHAQPGDVIVPIPEWYTIFRERYDMGPSPIILAPEEARLVTKVANADTIGPGKPFADDFERLLGKLKTPETVPPPGAWLFMVEPEQRLPSAARLLEAYGLSDPRFMQELQAAAKGGLTLTVRLAPGRMEHLTVTTGRAILR